ncbi:MAG TPA: glycoside hydrolase family 2, partial [Candidatus Merdenecus merdavium]|nr:glycoside hydrolase family 2 [Candidatus Merdenecus merdavium]
EDVRWFSLGNETKSLVCTMDQPLGLNVSNYTDEEIEVANHPWQLKKAEDIIIHLDYLHSGLGSNSCGQEQLEEHKVKRQDFSMSFNLQITHKGLEEESAMKKYIDSFNS